MPKLVFNESSYGLDEYRINSKRIAATLLAKGIQADSTIAILMRNDVTLFEVIEACRYLEVSFLPLNWHATGAELSYILQDSGAKILVSHEDLFDSAFSDGSADTILQSITTLSYPTPSNIYASYGLKKPNMTFVNAKCEDLYALLQTAQPVTTETKPFRGLLAYTSGSTGKPKGIRRQVKQNQPDLYPVYEGLARSLLKLNSGDRYYIAAPLYHSAPNTLSLCCLAAQDVDVYIEPKFVAEQFLADIERHKITHVYIVPTMMIRLLKLPDETKAKYDVSSLKFGISSGSAWPADEIGRAHV